ncbi:MAG: hypothetical protein HZB46_09440 [Solirubrobacterales bacterium]|nr:hypothetical protein [Solirubrobacterales bacterium]
MAENETGTPGYAERDDAPESAPSGAGNEAPQGGEHFGEAPLGEGDDEAADRD